jgi:hypothetical protein
MEILVLLQECVVVEAVVHVLFSSPSRLAKCASIAVEGKSRNVSGVGWRQ